MAHCETQTYHFSDDGTIPNNRLPLVVLHQCLDDDEAAVRATLGSNNWGDIWVDGIYDYTHFHSTAHEFLGILQGSATLQLGGENGVNLDVSKGDVLILPAGTGHKALVCGPAFSVLGAYPDNQKWDICTGKKEDHDRVRQNILKVPLPNSDPIDGKEGTLLKLWRET